MTLKRMKDRLDDVSKGLLHIEADRINRTRIDRFTAMAGQYAALCIASGVRTQELWSGFLQVCGCGLGDLCYVCVCVCGRERFVSFCMHAGT